MWLKALRCNLCRARFTLGDDNDGAGALLRQPKWLISSLVYRSQHSLSVAHDAVFALRSPISPRDDGNFEPTLEQSVREKGGRRRFAAAAGGEIANAHHFGGNARRGNNIFIIKKIAARDEAAIKPCERQ